MLLSALVIIALVGLLLVVFLIYPWIYLQIKILANRSVKMVENVRKPRVSESHSRSEPRSPLTEAAKSKARSPDLITYK